MADINDPLALGYINNIVRPISEQLRAIKYQLDSALVTWNNQMSGIIPDSDSDVIDGREAEGVSRIKGRDVVNVINIMNDVRDKLDLTGVENKLDKTCVRTLSNTL